MRMKVFSRAGDRLGPVTLLEAVDRNKYGSIIWKAKCDCGKVVTVTPSVIRYNKARKYCSVDCGLFKNKFEDKIFGDFKVLGLTESCGRYNVECVNCGLKRVVHYSFFKSFCRCKCNPAYGYKCDDKIFTVNGETHNVSEWARRAGISRQAMFQRLKEGGDNNEEQVANILTSPKNKYHNNQGIDLSIDELIDILKHRREKRGQPYIRNREFTKIISVLEQARGKDNE